MSKPRVTTLVGMNSKTGIALLPSETGKSTAAERLLAMSGLAREEYLKRFHRVNVLRQARWSRWRARAAGAFLRRELRGDVIVLGREAWRSMGLPRTEFFESFAGSGGATFYLVPHPSGRNLLYNDRASRLRLKRLLRRVIR
jgi:hypothetical protein